MTFSSDERSKLVRRPSFLNSFAFFATQTHTQKCRAPAGKSKKKKGLTWAFGFLTFHGRFEGGKKKSAPAAHAGGRSAARTELLAQSRHLFLAAGRRVLNKSTAHAKKRQEKEKRHQSGPSFPHTREIRYAGIRSVCVPDRLRNAPPNK